MSAPLASRLVAVGWFLHYVREMAILSGDWRLFEIPEIKMREFGL
jgi:hypothetical protein